MKQLEKYTPAYAFAALIALLVSSPLAARDVSYSKDIKPIIQRSCQGCHQPATKMGGLVLTEYDEITKGGQKGPIFVAGSPDTSRVVGMLSGKVEPLMPMGGKALPGEEIELFRLWVEQGAKDDTPASEKGPQIPEKPPVYTQAPLISGLSYSPDGSLLAVGAYKEIVLLKADGSETVARLLGKSERINSLAFTPDGTKLIAVGGAPARYGEIQVWDVASRKLLRSIDATTDTLFGGAVSPDGKYVCIGGADKGVRVIEIDTGKELFKAGHHEDWVLDAAFGIDGKRVVTVGRDRAAKLADAKTGAFLENVNLLREQLFAIERHPRRDYVLIGGMDRVPYLYMMDRPRALKIADDSTLVRKFEEQKANILALAFSPDGNRIAVGGLSDEVPIYNTETGERVATCKGVPQGIFVIQFHPDGDKVALGGFDGRVRIYNPTTGELLKNFAAVPITQQVASN
jgi:hypothetical protein